MVVYCTGCPRISVPKVNTCFSVTAQPILVIFSPNKSQLLGICCVKAQLYFFEIEEIAALQSFADFYGAELIKN